MIYNSTREKRERVSRMMQMHANHREDIEQIGAGGIAAVGLKDTTTGDTLCDADKPVILESITFPDPVIHIAVEPKTKDDESRMGELHLEVLVDRMKREYRVETNVGKPEVAYKETITQHAKAEGRFVRQTGGRGQYGVARIEIEPRDRGEGYEFVDKVVGGEVPREFIGAIEQGIKGAIESGTLGGSPVIAGRVILTGGDHHPVDSSENAFKTAGSMAFQAAMDKAGPVLLEPVMKLEISTPDEFYGPVQGDVIKRRGEISEMDQRGTLKVIRATVPLAETFGYATELRSLTQGRASYSMEFDRFAEVPRNVVEKVLGTRTRKPRRSGDSAA